MTRFYPLYCRRSDGKLEAGTKSKRKELNQPTDDQLDQKPDKNGVSDYYREVAPEETKHLDWRRKLGGMLARELDWKDKNAQAGNESGYILVAFPENYRLYEHVKKVVKDGKAEVKSKTHAAGGNERQDAYLYGHPEGRKKRYRSPGDFFPHLLWLCTDEKGQHDNCSCKICSPDDPDDAEPRPVGRPKSQPESGVKTESAVGVTRPASSQGSVMIKPDPAVPAAIQRTLTQSTPITPTTLQQPRTQDQQIDLQYNNFIYRSGELVWFSRGAAWGLGAILRRWVSPENERCYMVQPLSHPMSHPPSVVKTSQYELRPWLAWSVPRYTHDGLNNMPEPPRYENADWQGMKQGRYGPGDLEVDGSILAAKAVDSSYTLLEPIHTYQPEASVSETRYNRLYLGAEMFWLGDAVRLASGSGTDVLVLHAVIARTHSATGRPDSARSSVFLVGDTYKIHSTQHSDRNAPSPASSQNNPHLPQRLTEDLKFRNDRSIPAKHIASYWKLSLTNHRIELDEVKGRWYEASLLLPILLQKGQFEDAARKGEIQEASLWMNARGDCLNSNRAASIPRIPRQNIRRSTRREAFGAAVPSGAEIRDGIESPLPASVDPALGNNQTSMDIDPRFDTAESDGHDAGPEDANALDAFMDLDGMEDSQSQMPGFGKEYGSQSNEQHGFF